MTAGNYSKKKILAIVSCILVIIVLIKLTSLYPLWIEQNYSRGLYRYISVFFRCIFGWIPFSLGDILYAVAGFILVIAIIRFVKIVFNKDRRRQNQKRTFLNLFLILCAIYISFNLFWELNYNRPGIAYELSLVPSMNRKADLEKITTLLLKKVNETRLTLGAKRVAYKPYQRMFEEAHDAFKTTSVTYPFLIYKTASVKKSMYGRLGNFLGFLGYYNPFTGEAQVNLTQPRFLIPFVTCHEMAHQLGYASESEANFVGYLAATHSKDTLFHYSAYFDLFNYANRELFYSDSLLARNNYNELDTLVKTDQEELREYWRKSDNMIEPIIRIFYDRYLKANQQSKGVRSYNEVVDWLIAYYNKYGHI